MTVLSISSGVLDLLKPLVFDSSPRNGQENFVKVQKNTGCYSLVGMNGGQQLMSLATGCFTQRTVVHEFIHAFGFFHEHMRTDRDNHVQINFDNISPGQENNFQIFPGTTDINEYDGLSVMHYSGKAFSSNGLYTIESIVIYFDSDNTMIQ